MLLKMSTLMTKAQQIDWLFCEMISVSMLFVRNHPKGDGRAFWHIIEDLLATIDGYGQWCVTEEEAHAR